MADILADLGATFLGSRLKRLAERLQGDAARIIRAAGFPIQPAQFPMLAAVDRYGPISVGRAAELLGVSQPVVTRTLTGLIDAGLLETTRDEADLRHKTIRLTPAGTGLMARAKPLIWPRVDAAVQELCAPLSGDFLTQVAQLEAALDARSLEARVAARPPAFSVLPWSPDRAADFYRISAEWVEAMFRLEENDIQILTRPEELIIARGGDILFVATPDLGVIGTCALMKIEDGVFELTKMGVSAAARGRKAGEFLLAATLERARAIGMTRLYLLTNRSCAAAIHLYEKHGFVHSEEIMERYGSRYARCDVAMDYRW
ncbi:bifunctional helix-turn-helix transcriptional regulator/GNAT family N-acetyltransferase [Sphingomonas morindae]|uniref:Bifunctional helix-turn-helix transcriptional regulator/GNAT family N-acetyltransferase n=1 Tax=Sphingomonas morindae TaxID=1541170 RepID=A0ABY4XDH8_9SPHN|nr:bifunctional helix-turn-helix transcriptional regulator/GNAT family N-acetyltransferase [Sphingomonas morindae]USI74977.1 bifunctional helix-turn-helix transcriptional regulator/GNAT family N-acetyltransferase [Sphingomonas morindae]